MPLTPEQRQQAVARLQKEKITFGKYKGRTLKDLPNNYRYYIMSKMGKTKIGRLTSILFSLERAMKKSGQDVVTLEVSQPSPRPLRVSTRPNNISILTTNSDRRTESHKDVTRLLEETFEPIKQEEMFEHRSMDFGQDRGSYYTESMFERPFSRPQMEEPMSARSNATDAEDRFLLDYMAGNF